MRILTTPTFGLLLVAVICSAAGVAASELAARIDAVVQPYVEAGDFMGVVGVQRDGEAPLLRAYGLASVELDAPHRPDGIFMIGSVSKQFTGAAILLLEQDGLLATDDPAQRFLPELVGPPVTIEQLLTHTGGIVDIYSLDRFGRTAGLAAEFDAVIADLCAAPRTGEPGAAYAYSNGGFALLAAIIERASGLSYGTFLETRIFAPLGLERSAHDAPGATVVGRVPGYDPWGVRDLMPARPLAPGFAAGSGSLWSSAADLLAWSRALHDGRMLTPESHAKFVRDHGHGYGYGVSIFKRFGRAVVGHDGRVSGYASDLARYVDDGVTIVVLSNVQSVARDRIRRVVAAVVFGEEVDPVPARAFLPAPPGELAEFAGGYRFGPGFDVTVAIRDGRVMARANQGGWSELVALEDGAWFSRMLDATVRFGRDDAGAVDRLIWGSGEGAPAGQRLP